MKIKGEKIKLEFSKRFYEEYKKDVEVNLGRKVGKREVVREMVVDLLGMYEKIEDYYEK